MLVQEGSTSSIGKKLDQIVASVAPPRPTTRTLGNAAFKMSGECTGIQSPLMNTRRRELDTMSATSPVDRKGTSCINAAGAESQKVIGSLDIMSSRRLGSWMSCRAASRMEPPAARMPKMS